MERQRQLSDSLLLNILPEEIAEELRQNDSVEPKYFEDVSILFTDFVGFTLSTEKLAAENLVHLLNDYFTAFDEITARYGIEKMKTIGDAYMCVSGLPRRNPSHPVDIVLAAFEILHTVEELGRREGSPGWGVRIGIHTGPVIAGVVGIKKFAFDVWGESVNYSSRMESSGASNRINLSERTHSRVKDFFACEYRGKVMTKDKRELDMYFANGILPELVGGFVPGSASRISAPVPCLLPEATAVLPGVPAGVLPCRRPEARQPRPCRRAILRVLTRSVLPLPAERCLASSLKTSPKAGTAVFRRLKSALGMISTSMAEVARMVALRLTSARTAISPK